MNLSHNPITISIIVPAFNAGIFLKNCVFSIFENKEKSFEVIVVDDGSTDNSINEIETTFKSKILTNRLIIINQKNQGVSVARNTGMDNARGEFICFIDADDLITQNYISELRTVIKQHCPDVIEFGFKQFTSLNHLGKEKYILDFDGMYTLKQVTPNINAKSTGYSWVRVFKKETLSSIRFPVGVRFCEDLMFCIDAFKQCENIYFLKKPLYLYRRNESGATLNVHEDYKLNILKYLKNSNIKNSYEDALLKVNFAYVCYRCDFERHQFLKLPLLTHLDFKLAAIKTLFDKRIDLRKKLIAIFPLSFRIYQLIKRRF